MYIHVYALHAVAYIGICTPSTPIGPIYESYKIRPLNIGLCNTCKLCKLTVQWRRERDMGECPPLGWKIFWPPKQTSHLLFVIGPQINVCKKLQNARKPTILISKIKTAPPHTLSPSAPRLELDAFGVSSPVKLNPGYAPVTVQSYRIRPIQQSSHIIIVLHKKNCSVRSIHSLKWIVIGSLRLTVCLNMSVINYYRKVI